jgi:hypothetical protein
MIRQALLFCLLGFSAASLKIPFLSKKKEYTPLLFFTVPKDNIPECDEMEKVVSEVEKELGVHVERLDILKDANAEATLSVLTTRRPPYLYNRESLQKVYSPGVSDGAKNAASSPIDKERVISWAKGRFLPAQTMTIKSKAPTVLVQQDNAIDQADLIEDMTLSPSQKSGKEAMKKRTKDLAKDKK